MCSHLYYLKFLVKHAELPQRKYLLSNSEVIHTDPEVFGLEFSVEGLAGPPETGRDWTNPSLTAVVTFSISASISSMAWSYWLKLV